MRHFSLILLTLLSTSLQLHAAEGNFEDLGVQLTSMTLQGTAFTKDPAGGRDLACAVVRGAPAKLVVLDAKTGELLHRLPLDGANGAWNATTASDGSVYIGTDDNGHLYRWVPGETAVQDLGQVAPEQSFAWDVAAGAEGEVFVGTYPGCNVIRYHPKDGFRDLGKGAVALGQKYARGLDFDSRTGKVYVGVGTKAHLIELDPVIGAKRNILPEKFSDFKFAYSVDARGGKLFVMLTDGFECIVLDPASGEIEATIPSIGGQQVVSQKSPHDNKVYINSEGTVRSYDLQARQVEATSLPVGLDVTGMHWVDSEQGQVLTILTKRQGIIRFNPRTGESSTVAIEVPPEPTPIQSICRGPDGRIYSGGYLIGGLAAFDPKTGKHEQLGRISQPESIGVMRGKLYLGLYPRARLMSYDPRLPWDGTNNPRQFEELDRFEQDRPFATLGIDALNKVFFGSVPDYGRLTGSLSIHDAGGGTTKSHRNVVKDQSIVSLTYAHGYVVGGSTISGGLGIAPVAEEAKLFIWDPTTNQKVYQTTPVPGAWLITGLTVGPEKHVWGVADDTLFEFDVLTRKVLSTTKLFALPESARQARWRNAVLELHRNGRIYGTMGGKLFRIEPRTKQVTILRDKGADLLAMDDDGAVYFREKANLWRFKP